MAGIEKVKADHQKALARLEELQRTMGERPLNEAEGAEADGLVVEAKGLQAQLERYESLGGIVADGRKAGERILPPAGDEGRKSDRVRTTPGHLFVASEAFKAYKANGKQGWSAPVGIKGVGGQVIVERKEFNEEMLSDLGVDAVVPFDRDPEVTRYEEPEFLTIEALLNVSPTTSDTIRFVKHTATNRAAASQQGRGAAKPYLNVSFDTATVPVETIAVLSKVTEQDIDDAPRLVGIINGEMTLDVRVEKERQILWGSGDDNELEGIFTAGIPEFTRSVQDDTLIDTIRRMRTDIRLQRMVPNGILTHPLDWEAIELEKGSDNRYVWAVIQTPLGPRIWGVPVVDSEAAENPETGERRLVVADWQRGATLYNRNDVRLAVGYVDDDFARNLRTLRAEVRCALALRRDYAFTYTVTAEGGES